MNSIKLESRGLDLRYKLSVQDATEFIFVCVVTKERDTMLELRTKVVDGDTCITNVEVSELCGAPDALVIDLRVSGCETHRIIINNVVLTIEKGTLVNVEACRMRNLCETCTKHSDCVPSQYLKAFECLYYTELSSFKFVSESSEARIERVYELTPSKAPYYIVMIGEDNSIVVRFTCRKIAQDTITTADILDNFDYRRAHKYLDIPNNGRCIIKVNDVALEFESGKLKDLRTVQWKF